MGTNPSMKRDLSTRQLSRGERETETAATRLIEHVDEALAAVAGGSTTEIDSLEGVADRIERAARDLAGALRELAHERHSTNETTE